jgi:hypothetical protein
MTDNHDKTKRDEQTKYDKKVADESTAVSDDNSPHWMKDVFNCPHCGAYAQPSSLQQDSCRKRLR